MVRVAVVPELVVGDHDMRLYLADDLHQMRGSLEKVRAPERVRMQVGPRRRKTAVVEHHPGVSIAARATEETVVGDPDDPHRLRKFEDPMLAQPVLGVGRQMGEIRDEHLTLFAESAGHQGDAHALVGVPGHRDPARDHLVVRVGMHQQQSKSRSIHTVSLRTSHSATAGPRHADRRDHSLRCRTRPSTTVMSTGTLGRSQAGTRSGSAAKTVRSAMHPTAIRPAHRSARSPATDRSCRPQGLASG